MINRFKAVREKRGSGLLTACQKRLVLILSLLTLNSSLLTLSAASLSLVSTNDYVFTTPFTTNLLGVGIGESGDYSIPRTEDVDFLREAWVERYSALGPDDPVYREADFPPRGLPIVNGHHLLYDRTLALFFPESFDRFDAHYRLRSYNNSFVAPDFTIGTSTYRFFECEDDDYNFEIDGEKFSCTESYWPFVGSLGARIVPPDNLRTNGYNVLPLSIQVMTNLYHNLALTTDVVTAPSRGDHWGRYESASLGYNMYENRSYDTVEFNVTDVKNSRGQVVSVYNSSIKSRVVNTQHNYIRKSAGILPYISIEENTERTYVHHLDWILTNPDATSYDDWKFRPYIIAGPFESVVTYANLESITSDVSFACSDCITTQNVDLCSSVRVYGVAGIRRTLKDRIEYGDYSGRAPVETVENEYYVCTWPFPERGHQGAFDGKPVFTGGGLLNVLLRTRSWIDGNSNMQPPSAIRPSIDNLPQLVGPRKDRTQLTASHTLTRTYTIERIGFIFRFKRDFNAKVL